MGRSEGQASVRLVVPAGEIVFVLTSVKDTISFPVSSGYFLGAMSDKRMFPPSEATWDLSPWFDDARGPKVRARRVAMHEAQKGLCYYCGRKTQLGEFTREHRTPKARGGRGVGNYVGACKLCNAAKGSMTEVEFLDTDYLSNERRAALGRTIPPTVKYHEARDEHDFRIGIRPWPNGNLKYRPLG